MVKVIKNEEGKQGEEFVKKLRGYIEELKGLGIVDLLGDDYIRTNLYISTVDTKDIVLVVKEEVQEEVESKLEGSNLKIEVTEEGITNKSYSYGMEYSKRYTLNNLLLLKVSGDNYDEADSGELIDKLMDSQLSVRKEYYKILGRKL